MSKHFSKSTTALHFDGKASIQKSQELQDRAISLSNRIKTLEVRVDNAIGRNSGSLGPLYKQCRNAYKTSKAALADIRNGLETLEWHTCECPFQADTHIAELYQADNNKDDLAIITADSDMMVYQDVREITIPVGKYRAFTTYKKADLLESLDLVCDRELLLASIITKNDYSKALPWHGFQRNIKIIQEMRIETRAGDGSTMDAPGSKTTEAGIIKELIQEYLQRARGGQNKSVDDYTHAISAFVQVREDYLDSATPSCATHEEIRGILQKLEKCKLQRRNMTRASRTNPPADTLASDTSAGVVFSSPIQYSLQTPGQQTILQARRRRRRHKKENAQQRRKRRSKGKERRKKVREAKWRRSRYKSRDGDANPRYSPHVVMDVSQSCPVDKIALEKMSIEEPRPRKKKDGSIDDNPKAASETKTKPKVDEENGEKVERQAGANLTKHLFGEAFKTATMTAGVPAPLHEAERSPDQDRRGTHQRGGPHHEPNSYSRV
ncbi:hypothetical protein BC939DRAFT_520100 [Gamsiella multidivaricata]|uniref:uncharacterized protein n=1 Tax=Gamsiella multidivaricata TaxID=101098 RepID=UPI002220D579|nr:uncharacterized protein BC939DRAFT_520100 [Gamsiella multidivaricata]KAI7819765.1 hypothetical protein BC939DRAFT_520100 [Gamsiella multidivaricata]